MDVCGADQHEIGVKCDMSGTAYASLALTVLYPLDEQSVSFCNSAALHASIRGPEVDAPQRTARQKTS